jgi:Rha family phage regulatory protein
MNELLTIGNNNKAVTSSRKIAKNFGKEHKHIMESIRVLETQISTVEFSTLFETRSYVASNGKVNPEYIINRDGFTLLAMGFTGKNATEWKMKYIKAFNSMEKKLTVIYENEVNSKIKELNTTLDEVKQYYRFPHSAKINFNKRIKSKLGEECTKSEVEDVKEYVFTLLAIDTWEDLPLDKRTNVIDLIDRRCNIIVNTRKNLFNWDKM